MMLTTSALLLASFCGHASPPLAVDALLPLAARQNAGKQDPKPTGKSGEELLDAEREKLRMKDVEGWKKLPIKSMDEVIDVKATTQPLDMAAVTDEEKAKLEELLKKAQDAGGGARTGRALREMEKMGYPALLFLINHLREVDYKDTDAAFWGMQVNQTLTNITKGINTGYVAVELGEPMDPRKAQRNSLTVAEWIKGVNGPNAHWSTREKFDNYLAKRKALKDAELEAEESGKTDKPAPTPEPKKQGG